MGRAARYQYSQWTERHYGDISLARELVQNTVLARWSSVEVQVLFMELGDRRSVDIVCDKMKLRSRPYGQ